jgi:hypothetical protein
MPRHFYCSALLLLFGLAAVGCETRVHTRTTSPAPNTTERVTTIQTDPPVREKAKVNVDVGNGRGINVDVDAPRRRKADADVDVNVGGPRGVDVKVDKDGL